MAGNDPSLGDVFGRLLDDARAYAQAEIELVRLRAERKALSYRSAAIFLGIALALGVAAAAALTVTLVLWFASLLGPLAGGLLATALVGGAAALCALTARRKFETADDE